MITNVGLNVDTLCDIAKEMRAMQEKIELSQKENAKLTQHQLPNDEGKQEKLNVNQIFNHNIKSKHRTSSLPSLLAWKK